MQDPTTTLFHQLGESVFRSMVAAFYRRVKEDNLIHPMYPQDDWDGAEQRLADFIIFRFGGPQTYMDSADTHACSPLTPRLRSTSRANSTQPPQKQFPSI